MLSRKPRILYVEDHDDTRELVRTVLGIDYEVVDLPSIASAVEAVGKHDFDLIILDSRLPDGSGLEFCEAFCKNHPNTPVMFYSAAAYEVDRSAALASGACEYLVKPAPPTELIEAVKSLLARRRIYARACTVPFPSNSTSRLPQYFELS